MKNQKKTTEPMKHEATAQKTKAASKKRKTICKPEKPNAFHPTGR
jgi:hypothetical protein